MNVEELKEGAEHAHESGQKTVGLTMALVAVLLAVATLLSHRAHTEEGLLQGKIVDQWNFYQAKHARAHEYGEFAEVLAVLPNPNARDLAVKNYKRSLDEECGTPAEHGCTSPVNSAVLRSLLADTNTEDGKQAKGEHGPAPKAEEGTKGPAKENSASAEEHENKPGGPKPGANKIQDIAREMEHERDLLERRADYYDASDLFLEISIVLCSIALLAGMKLFWKLSFITTIIGTAVMLWGVIGLH